MEEAIAMSVSTALINEEVDKLRNAGGSSREALSIAWNLYVNDQLLDATSSSRPSCKSQNNRRGVLCFLLLLLLKVVVQNRRHQAFEKIASQSNQQLVIRFASVRAWIGSFLSFRRCLRGRKSIEINLAAAHLVRPQPISAVASAGWW